MTSEPYVFSSDSLPSHERFLPPLANGLLGWRVFHRSLHVGGVYNGEGGACHRAELPCPLAVRMQMDSESDSTYSLDTRAGVFTHSMVTGGVRASQLMYAHRLYPRLLVMEVMLEREEPAEEPLTVQLHGSFSPYSEDVDFRPAPQYRGGRHIQGKTLVPEVHEGPCFNVHLLWTPVPMSLTLQQGQTCMRWTFFLAVGDSSQSAEAAFDVGLELSSSGELCPCHCQAWAELWAGCGLELTGPMRLRKALIGCLFYLLGALPGLGKDPLPFGGISPGGLSNGRQGQDYWGHVFWDQDTWMFPGIALFYPQLVRAILSYRVKTLEGAKENAAQQGYKGVKFPWESAVSGREVCKTEIYGQQEIHINGDVSMAFRQYLYLTQDVSLFLEGGAGPAVWGVADYWVSRVTWSEEERCYHITGVIPPDEYYRNVNNSVYTNTVAKYSLQFAVELAELLKRPVPPEWQHVANNIKIPFSPEEGFHPEFDGYTKGKPVKQADVVLLGFPLQLPMSSDVRRNDLMVYESVSDPHGPAMTWGMYAVGWLELGEAEKAQQLLSRCFRNIQGPFQVWSENADGSGAVNFLTGMGGFLQAVLFGYTGYRLQRNSLDFDPVLPGDVTELRVRGIAYLGNKLDWVVGQQEIYIKVREEGGDCCALEVVLKSTGSIIPLKPGVSVNFPRGPGQVRKVDLSSSCWPL